MAVPVIHKYANCQHSHYCGGKSASNLEATGPRSRLTSPVPPRLPALCHSRSIWRMASNFSGHVICNRLRSVTKTCTVTDQSSPGLVLEYAVGLAAVLPTKHDPFLATQV